jgi:hypothetical protein
LALLVPVLASSSLRRSLRERLAQIGVRARAIVVALAFVGLACKLVLVLLAPSPPAFVGCYTPAAPGAGLGCASSFDEVFRAVAGTRTDSSLAFGSSARPYDPPSGLSESNWDLVFANDLAFDWYLPISQTGSSCPSLSHGKAGCAPTSENVLLFAM